MWPRLQLYLVLIITFVADIFGPHHKNYYNHKWSSPILYGVHSVSVQRSKFSSRCLNLHNKLIQAYSNNAICFKVYRNKTTAALNDFLILLHSQYDWYDKGAEAGEVIQIASLWCNLDSNQINDAIRVYGYCFI